MGETANIAAAAEQLAQELFADFGWARVGPMNENWACASPQHELKTHPTDAVFAYEDPYEDRTVFVQTDLKSYAAGSISSGKLSSALRALGMATDCTRRSAEWQEMYRPEGSSGETVGLLFVFNHDGDFDKNFPKLLAELDERNVNLVKGCRVHVLGPQDIQFLVTVTHDMNALRGKEKLPPRKDCGFSYPHLVQQPARHLRSPVASLEVLSSPWIIYRYTWRSKPESPEGCIVYLRSRGETSDELKYLLDYLFRFQVIEESTSVEIRVPHPAPNIHANFAFAKTSYAQSLPGHDYVGKLLEQVRLQSVTQVATRYLTQELGMDRG